MKFRYYFAKVFESTDNHELNSLRSHYYRSSKQQVIDACIETLKEMKARIENVEKERGEIMFDAAAFSGTVTVVDVSYIEISADMCVLTYNILPTAKGKKIIEDFYSRLDKKLTLKRIGSNR